MTTPPPSSSSFVAAALFRAVLTCRCCCSSDRGERAASARDRDGERSGRWEGCDREWRGERAGGGRTEARAVPRAVARVSQSVRRPVCRLYTQASSSGSSSGSLSLSSWRERRPAFSLPLSLLFFSLSLLPSFLTRSLLLSIALSLSDTRSVFLSLPARPRFFKSSGQSSPPPPSLSLSLAPFFSRARAPASQIIPTPPVDIARAGQTTRHTTPRDEC